MGAGPAATASSIAPIATPKPRTGYCATPPMPVLLLSSAFQAEWHRAEQAAGETA
jgi:hypothetical protein